LDRDKVDQVDIEDIAAYVRDMSHALALTAREAGLITVAAGLEQAHRAAAAEASALQTKRKADSVR
jgi:hypothetical protein